MLLELTGPELIKNNEKEIERLTIEGKNLLDRVLQDAARVEALRKFNRDLKGRL